MEVEENEGKFVVLPIRVWTYVIHVWTWTLTRTIRGPAEGEKRSSTTHTRMIRV